MSSRALRVWQKDRLARLGTLFSHHTAISGGGPGRKYRTLELNWALILQLAAEFQGYCRDLHDEATDVFVQRAAPLDVQLQSVLRGMLTLNRFLDRGNANPGNLGADFGRFGLPLWDELKRRRPTYAPAWNKNLEGLSEARNAIAHADEGKMRELQDKGLRLDHLATVKTLRKSVNAMIEVLDVTLAEHLGMLFNIEHPW